MRRLIDAERLMGDLAAIAANCARSDAQKALMGRVMYNLEKQPTADAEVVRCAECRHCYDAGPDPLVPYDGEDVWHCEMWGREASAYQVDPYRFFCAKGERRKAT